MHMTPDEAVEYLHSLPRNGSGPTLERMKNLLHHLGDPQKGLPCVHVAGTNGKGTVCTFTASILRQAGYKVGLTISPFVVDFRERFQINGEMIPPEELAEQAQAIKAASEAIEAEGQEPPVQFEAVTAVAIRWFSQQKCDFVVLETGLGGRFDATTAVPDPLVAAITCIGMDHMEMLGDTLEKIAQEKCGIIQPGCTVVCYPEQPKEALREIIVAAGQNECELVVPELEDLEFLKGRPFENRIDYGGYQAALPFAGRHQAYNATMAVEIALALWRKGYEISDEAILAGLEQASFPARIERISQKPLILLDGCHNPDGAAALAATLKEAGCSPMTAVMGVMADKSVGPILEALEGSFKSVYTVAPNCPRAMSAKELARLASEHFESAVACDTLEQALQAASAHGDFAVCGSLYLASEARPHLIKMTSLMK